MAQVGTYVWTVVHIISHCMLHNACHLASYVAPPRAKSFLDSHTPYTLPRQTLWETYAHSLLAVAAQGAV